MDMGLLLQGNRSAVPWESVRIMLSVLVGIALCLNAGEWTWLPVIIFTGTASMIHLVLLSTD